MDITKTQREYLFMGRHFVASYLGCDPERLTAIDQLRDNLLEAIKASGATILSMTDYRFDGDGYTAAIILSESHATIHTYPEFGACFVDLFTCGNKCSHKPFDDLLQAYLRPQSFNYQVIQRKEETKVIEAHPPDQWWSFYFGLPKVKSS